MSQTSLTSPVAVQLSWDVVEYSTFIGARPTGRNNNFESRVQERYVPVVHSGSRFIDQPAIIHDSAGRIICWNLPGVLQPNRQVRPSQPKFCHIFEL